MEEQDPPGEPGSEGGIGPLSAGPLEPDYQSWSREELIASLRRLGSSLRRERELEDPLRLVHELQVHQVELERQNRELRDLQARMEASRDLYADLYEFAPVAYLTVDPEGVIRSVNLTGAGMIGLERGALIGQPLFGFVDPADTSSLQDFLNTMFRERHPGFREIRLAGAGEAAPPRTVILEGIRGTSLEDGTMVGRLALTDITARKRAEEVQRRAKRALQALHEVHQATRSVSDESTLLNHVCRFLTEEGGYTLACVATRMADGDPRIRFLASAGTTDYLDRIEGALRWGDPAGPWDPFGRAVASGTPVTARLGDPDSPLQGDGWAARDYGLDSVIGLPLSDGERVMGVLALFSTEPEAFQQEELDWLFRLADEVATACVALHQRFEREAAERERDWLVEILDATPDFVEIADADGSVLYRNPGAWSLLEVAEDSGDAELRIDGYQPQWARDRLVGEVLPTVRERGIWRGEMALQSSQGEEIPVSQIVLGHRGADGQIERISTVAHDMRPFMQKRTELERFHRLIALGELASVLAHQLNQPLTAAANYAEGSLYRLESGSVSQQQVRPGVVKALEQIRVAGGLVQNLRNFLRSGEPDLRPISINGLIREVVPTVDVRRFQVPFEFRLELTRDLPAVAADPLQIQEALLNLIQNAGEAMESEPPSAPQVTIATQRTGDQVEVQVRDRGVGLPASLQEDLHQPLFTTKEKGMGLGLSICSSVAEIHGGRFWAETNTDGPGTTFHLALPLHPEDEYSQPAGP